MFVGYLDRLEELFVPSGERTADAPEEFLSAVRTTALDGIRAELERLIAELGDDYVAAAPEQVGLSVVPGGPELYRYRVRLHSTTNLSPDEIHQIGLDEVARLEGEMAELRDQIGFEGESEETEMKDFLDAVRTDPRFIAKSPEEGRRALHELRGPDRAARERLLRRAA